MITRKFFLIGAALIIYSSSFAIERVLKRYSIPSGKYVLDALAVSSDGAGIKNAVIFIGGSGEWEIVDTYLKDPATSYGNMPRYYMEEEFLKRGFVFLYLNKRGIGKSTGKWKKTGFNERADDVVNAIAFLKETYQLTDGAIGLVGHSQGCWIAQLAAVRNPRIGFVINLAGPFMDPYRQTIINDAESFKCEGLSERSIKKKKFWRRKELALGRAVGPIIGGEAGHWARIARYDSIANRKTLLALEVPTLFVFCEYDVMVPPAENQAYAQKLFVNGRPANIEVYQQTGIDHYMHQAKSPCDPYPWTLNPVPPYSVQLREKLTDWISVQTGR